MLQTGSFWPDLLSFAAAMFDEAGNTSIQVFCLAAYSLEQDAQNKVSEIVRLSPRPQESG